MWWMFTVILVTAIAYELIKKSRRDVRDFYLPISGLAILVICIIGAYQNSNNLIRGWVWSGSLFIVALVIMAEYLSRESKLNDAKTDFLVALGIFPLSLVLAHYLLLDIPGVAAAIVSLGVYIPFLATLSVNARKSHLFRARSKFAISVSTILFLGLPNFVLNSQQSELYPYYNYPQAHDFGTIYDKANDFSEIDDIAKRRGEEIFSQLPKSQYFAVNLSTSDPVNDYLAQILLWPANVFEPENASMMNDLISKGFRNFVILGPTQIDLQKIESYPGFETDCFVYANPRSGDGEFCIAILN
jgi:hypothetical protein